MLGIKYKKCPPNVYVIKYINGKVVREGPGLSFFYLTATTSLVAVPLESKAIPFIFEEVTGDFQPVTVQGDLVFRVVEPRKLAEKLNLTLNAAGGKYEGDDWENLPARLINIVKVLTKKRFLKIPLKDVLKNSEEMADTLKGQLSQEAEITELGLQILGLNVLAIRPNPEIARALESGVREQLLKEADEAIYARRNSAVEQERTIKENELNTEVAVENKKRQIREARMEADAAIQKMENGLKDQAKIFEINQEEKNKDLVTLKVENNRLEADSRAYAMNALLKTFENLDAAKLKAIASTGMASDQLIALAFQELAGKAEKIGQLNISPELLRELLRDKAG